MNDRTIDSFVFGFLIGIVVTTAGGPLWLTLVLGGAYGLWNGLRA